MVSVAAGGNPRPNARYVAPDRPTVRDQLGHLSGTELAETYEATMALVRGLVPELTRTVDALDRQCRDRRALGRGEG
jgi:hypothetical protein